MQVSFGCGRQRHDRGSSMTTQFCGDGVTVTQSDSQQPLTPLTDDGASPISSLQFQTYDYSFRAIPKAQAKALIIEHHYKHRPCPISWAYGIESEGKVVGVLTVGKPASWSAMFGLVGEK